MSQVNLILKGDIPVILEVSSFLAVYFPFNNLLYKKFISVWQIK
jgi:hypothetical protein